MFVRLLRHVGEKGDHVHLQYRWSQREPSTSSRKQQPNALHRRKQIYSKEHEGEETGQRESFPLTGRANKAVEAGEASTLGVPLACWLT